MNIITRVDRFFRRHVWSVDLLSLSPIRRLGYRILRFMIMAGSEFSETALSFRASGLVYTTLLSLVPFIAVTFSVLKAFGIHEQIEPFLAKGLAPLGPMGLEIAHQIVGFVNNLKVGVLGLVGVGTLFVMTLVLIDQIEQSLNAVWRVRRSRPLARKFTDYLSVVLVGPVFVFVGFGLIVATQSSWLVQRITEIEPLGYLFMLITRLMPLIFLCSAFTFLYKVIPHTQVRFTSAFVGGLTAAVLWQIAGTAFAAFVVNSTHYAAIYSSLAILAVFLFWLYVGWVIVLVGAQVAYFHQHPSVYVSRMGWRKVTMGTRERLAIMALIHLTQRYLSSQKPTSSSELALTLNVPLSTLEDVIEAFMRSGILFRASEPPGLILGRPPEAVSVADVLDIVYEREPFGEESLGEPSDPVTNVIHRRNLAVRRELEGITLRSLALEAASISQNSTVSNAVL